MDDNYFFIKLIPCGKFIIEFNGVLSLEINIGNTWCTVDIQCRIYDVCKERLHCLF